MGDSFTFYSFLALLGCLFCGTFFAWLLYRRPSALTPRLNIILAIFRGLSLSLILWLLFSPLIRQISYTLEKPIVIIAQDNSQSAGTFKPAGFDSERYRKDLQQLNKDLSEKYDVRRYSFSDQVTSGLDFSYKGNLTDASALAGRLKDELINRNVGAVILATDGIFNRGGNPAADLVALKAPVYTIALGDTIPKKDVLITEANANELVYLDNDFTVEVQVQAYQCQHLQTKLTVTEDGKLVHEESVSLDANLVSKNIPVKLKASKLGQHKYTLVLSPVKGEVSLKNNSQQLVIEVIDDRKKVLIAAAGPHPDIAALREAISLNKRYEVSVVMNEELQHIDPKAYGLVILYQLPGLSGDASVFIRQLRLDKIPLWYIIGAQSNLSQFNQQQALVNLSLYNTALQYTYSDINKSSSAFDLNEPARKTIENFDPLQAPAVQVKVSGDFQTILNQRIGKMKTTLPQLFFANDNGIKTGYLLGEGLWKWRLSEARDGNGTTVFNELISKIVQYLSVKDDKRKFIVHPFKNPFDENERIQFNATLYNDSYVPVNTPDVNIQLIDEHHKVYNFTFSRFESAYQLDAGILPAGNYSYLASTALGIRKYTAKGSLFINPLVAEFQQTIANHHLLYQLSSQTNGKVYPPAQLSTIKAELLKSEHLKTLSYEDRKYAELISAKWLFGLILILLSTEWFLRKRNGAL
ncbi:hypothetical protein [Pedobacter sp. L105]|uniref:hypothetical protein n=1 Tax=Pedobacter sp. L105 TaxID=1641871 RepID=UPI00131DA230|nr:hypothetical protein [Pedobacter sp. L105]